MCVCKCVSVCIYIYHVNMTYRSSDHRIGVCKTTVSGTGRDRGGDCLYQ